MGYTNVAVNSSPGYVVDFYSLERTNGRQIDWANVPDAFKGSDGIKRIPGGSIVKVQSDGTIIPASGNSGTVKEILLEAQSEDSKVTSLSGVGTIVGGVLYEDLLPDYGDSDFGTWKTALANAGCTFKYQPYNNDNAVSDTATESGTDSGSGSGGGS